MIKSTDTEAVIASLSPEEQEKARLMLAVDGRVFIHDGLVLSPPGFPASLRETVGVAIGAEAYIAALIRNNRPEWLTSPTLAEADCQQVQPEA